MLPVAVACRVLKVSTSGFYEWRGRPASARDRTDAELANTIAAIHTASRQIYGVRRIHAQLRHGLGRRVSRKRVLRCMQLVGLMGCTATAGAGPASWPDLVQRQFRA